jgi:hypothetical protein
MNLLERLYKLVEEDPHHKGSYYASKLGHVTRRQVNRCLYSNACFFNLSETDRPAWKVVGPLKPTPPMWVQPPRHVFPPNPHSRTAAAVSLPEKIYATPRSIFPVAKLAYKNGLIVAGAELSRQ